MRLLDNISIRAKVLAAFGIILVAIAALATVSIARMAVMNTNAESIRNQYLPNTNFIGVIRFDMMRFRQIEAAHVLETEPADKAKEAATLSQLKQQIETVWSQYEKMPATGDEKAIRDNFRKSWQAYLAQDDQLLTLSNANLRDMATSLYIGDMRTVFNKVADRLADDGL
ncbi:MAG TPA: MCP four helix bundle domain-containing protein, partial [Stellaceae bacterium]|nr:MCP four helix bundle domain-containing protein [Stellaceae bacterium]